MLALVISTWECFLTRVAGLLRRDSRLTSVGHERVTVFLCVKQAVSRPSVARDSSIMLVLT